VEAYLFSQLALGFHRKKQNNEDDGLTDDILETNMVSHQLSTWQIARHE